MSSSRADAPDASAEPPGFVSEAVARVSRSIDTTALLRAGIGAVVAGLMVFGGWAASEANEPIERQAVATAPVSIESEMLSSWPAGPLAGPQPNVQSDQPVRPDGCVDTEPNQDITLQLTAAVSLWVFADPSDTVTANWRDDDGTQSFTVPQAHLEHPFTTGRITLTAETPTSETTLSLRSTSGPLQVCGIGNSVG